VADATSVIEDPNGLAITLSVENVMRDIAFSFPYSDLEDLYPVGSVIAVKEPYVCLGVSTGIAEVRVAMPMDIVPMPSWSGSWRFDSPVSASCSMCNAQLIFEGDAEPSPEELKELGDVEYGVGRYDVSPRDSSRPKLTTSGRSKALHSCALTFVR
jgi:hypothetical protein